MPCRRQAPAHTTATRRFTPGRWQRLLHMPRKKSRDVYDVTPRDGAEVRRAMPVPRRSPSERWLMLFIRPPLFSDARGMTWRSAAAF